MCSLMIARARCLATYSICLLEQKRKHETELKIEGYFIISCEKIMYTCVYHNNLNRQMSHSTHLIKSGTY